MMQILRMSFRRLFSLFPLFCSLFLSSCGMNTEQSALLLPLSYPPAASPMIISLNFVSPMEDERQFDIQYYVSNEEAGFLGYNLYINTIPASLESFLTEQDKNIYLERGIQPSFNHVDDPVSTKPADLKTQRITHAKAPPVPEPFYKCLLYFFRLRAYLRGAFESEASNEMQACASANPSACPSGTPCNP